jgi:23S rRNA (adenine2503-C2)-methyltransferase
MTDHMTTHDETAEAALEEIAVDEGAVDKAVNGAADVSAPDSALDSAPDSAAVSAADPADGAAIAREGRGDAVAPDMRVLPRLRTAGKACLIGMTRDGLAAAFTGLGLPDKQVKMRVAQVWQWLYARGATDFAQMTNLSKAFRAQLAENFRLDRPEIVTRQVSKDGTRKYLLRIDGGHEVEAVYIPEENRGTLCVSSQVGCTLNCTFCHTGTQTLVRNLTAGEIVDQVLVCRDDLDEWPNAGGRPPEKRLLSNIVLMGMGEPLYNTDNVRDAMRIVMDGEGVAISRRRITLSTSGVVPDIARAGNEIGAQLAISLHATTDEVRDKLVPINKKWNIAALIQACRDYPRLSNAERITFEYVMLKGVNDSDADARRLVQLIAGIPAKINLIPFNPWPNAPYERSDWSRIEAFAEIVNRAGYASPVRTPRGQDIMAACGQLKSATERARKSRAVIAAEAGLS